MAVILESKAVITAKAARTVEELQESDNYIITIYNERIDQVMDILFRQEDLDIDNNERMNILRIFHMLRKDLNNLKAPTQKENNETK